MKIYIFSFVILFLGSILQAEGQENSMLKKINKTGQSHDNGSEIASKVLKNGYLFLKDCSLSVGFGLTQFHGDVAENRDLNQALSVSLTKPLKDHNFIQAEFIKGSLSAQNSSTIFYNPRHTIGSVPVDVLNKGEKFNMEFIEFDLSVLINLSTLYDRLIYKSKKVIESSNENNIRKLNFLCKAGFGLNMFRSLRQELKTDRFIDSYGYDWMWQNDFENAGTQKSNYVTEGVFVLGIITKYNIFKNITIDFSATSRKGDADKFDAKISGKDDMFMLYVLGTTFRFW